EPFVERAQAVRVVELRREHRCHAEREHVTPSLGREAAQQIDDRQVGVRPRLIKPFLADGPGTVMWQPRQMAVQDKTKRALALGAHGRTATATRSRLVSSASPWMAKSPASMPAMSASRPDGQAAWPGSVPITTASCASMIEPL